MDLIGGKMARVFWTNHMAKYSRTEGICDYFRHFLVKFQGLGISGIKVHRITRIHNRILRTRFDDKLDLILDRDDISELTQYVQMNT